jgi:hypothetical protein
VLAKLVQQLCFQMVFAHVLAGTQHASAGLHGTHMGGGADAGVASSPLRFSSPWGGLDDVAPPLPLPLSLPLPLPLPAGAGGGTVQEALAMQVDLQRQLYASLEAQRALQAKFEQHTRYLTTIMAQQAAAAAVAGHGGMPAGSQLHHGAHGGMSLDAHEQAQAQHHGGGGALFAHGDEGDDALLAAVAGGFGGVGEEG